MNSEILDADLLNLANDIIVAVSRLSEVIDERKIEQCADMFAGWKGIALTGNRRVAVLRKVKSAVFFSKPYDFSIFAEGYHPWFSAEWKKSPSHYYWDRYRSYLLADRGMCVNHVQSLDKITSAIVDHLENPAKQGPWSRRGMVVGQVQSGKTANYIGVAAKAADCGYRFIVIMAGMLNALRDQTQRRFDEGFIGKVTAGSRKGDPVGVGNVSGNGPLRAPIYLTTADHDFRKTSAETVGLSVDAASEPIVLVIKKNATSLRNLTEWIRTNTSSAALKSLPFLLVDDEADNASVNVKSPENEPTRINGQIRTLLNLFGRNSYLGYTATPFANIFIDPETTDAEHGDDLFPRDFILTLDAPDTYLGPGAFFGDDSRDLVRSIHDVDESSGEIPVRHKKDFVLSKLPESLVDALHVFVLARAIRMERGEREFDCSALVNASRFRAVHAQLHDKVAAAMKTIRDAALANARLNDEIALSDSTLPRFKRLFDEEYSKSGAEAAIPWSSVKERLPEAASSIEVLTVNSDATAKKLDYSRENWPHGRCVVVVGGMSLSRGLTLEGLTVSYYLRNSIAYDTLMQMGRWFGYRPGYDDLCRVYMTDLCQDWYSHISLALEELMDDFRSMESWNLTPREFGLRVRAHPDAMIVTARNKMRTAQRVTVRLNYFGRLVETTKLSADPTDHESNRNLISQWVRDHGDGSQSGAAPERGWLWKDVPSAEIVGFSRAFKAHPLEELDKVQPICKYIEETPACSKWDVLLVSRSESDGERAERFQVGGMDVIPFRRRMSGAEVPSASTESAILVNGAKRRLGYARQERGGLLHYIDEAELAAAEKDFLEIHKAVTGNLYRSLREAHGGNPLLIIHVVSSNNPDQTAEAAAFRKNLVAVSWSFPGDSRNAKDEDSVEYDVNKVWYKNYIDQRVEDTDEYDDDDMEEPA